MAFHTRSNSFPSRSHPVLQEVDELLCRLRSSEATSASSSSISHKLSGLQDLHDCVDRLLQLPLSQQALAQEQNEKWANELLDGSLRLLDVSSSAKDAILQTKECVQDLQSIIRRRGGETGLTSEVRKYLTSRKMVKKAIQKAMKNLKGTENRSTFSSLNKDDETFSVVSKLREVEAITLAVFESLLSFISRPKSQPSSWSLVSKMMQSKKVACEEATEINEFAEVDAALNSLIRHKASKPSADDAHNQLDQLESCIQDQEQGLECLFRQMIKARVSLLNILNH
ncbi:PREDICTED: Protein of unknown function DUF241 [Prunus dulcis]|uniref:Uncharacterized protein n=1 Tax=Prunus dulcis TaxID=3755 RepID=A0A5E4FRG6_PRUDU|nr:uncharacterized protein LOC117638580 [Prunus dulcis]VVA30024.1 PREDICTED: Protein of unknown function DUF241 [Prunus dulcis]